MSWLMYSKKQCPYCDRARTFLEAKGIDLVEKKIDEDDSIKEELFKKVPNARTVPQIFHNGTSVGGWDKLEAYWLSLNA